MLLPSFILTLGLSSIASAATFYHEHRKEDQIQDTSLVGGPHGNGFSDIGFVNAASGHRRISKITIGPCDGRELSYIRFEFKDWSRPEAPVTVVEHGGIATGKLTKSIDLRSDERIVSVILRTGKLDVGVKRKTRLTGIGFITRHQPALSCGTYGNRDPATWDAPADRAFLYFSGASGNSVDNLMGHTIPLADY